MGVVGMEGTESRGRLFAGSCAAVTALAFSFAAMSGVMYDLKGEFLLDNAQVGLIGGAALWGMAISQIGFSSLCDVFGMRNLMRLACLGHVGGVLLFVTAGSFAGLFAGALVLAIANGMVEAVCNPLVATLYRDRKAAMLNRLHLWFPGGIVIGGLAIWGLDLLAVDWRVKLIAVIVPVLVYAGLLWRAHFPPTEAAEHGAPLGDAFRAVASTPILWLFLILMMVTMSLELGPNRWIPAVLEAGGLPGILVLVLINGVMALTRANAHAILDRVSPPVLLTGCVAVAGVGLLGLSFAQGLAQTVAAALVFAIGISVVWPTMMGFVAERAPRTGALGLGLMAAVGSLAVGVVTTPLLGRVADAHLLDAIPPAAVRAVAADAQERTGPLQGAARAIVDGRASPEATRDFLRRATAGEAGPAVAATAAPLLHAGENRSGLLSFRYLVPFAALVCLLLGTVALNDRRKGGYAAQAARARLDGNASA
ncbi:major facilitator superfamily MFS_1 [Rhizorhabdus wittichii RW1]|uniref:Major facilitator superfamily MFS_1 n=2 Tax=Rhizorhabdus wittichii TaxID=160791 RepID=A0A9J9LDD6_RHIWR|nr:major facilitator superfamily MFS_1 [Rhizorhabdus wittichii RW1]